MGRQAKTDRVPRTRCNGLWTEASFWGFIRSGLRKTSQRWPPLVKLALERVRRKSKSSNKLLKWEFRCSACRGWFPRKRVQVDHIESCGTLKTFEDLPDFVRRLFCEVEGLRILCKDCHEKRTKEEKANQKVALDMLHRDEEKLRMFRDVSTRMKAARGMPAAMRVDLLAESIKEHRIELPVFLRWIWNPECRANVKWRDLRDSSFIPDPADEPLGFWHMMHMLRQRGITRDEVEQSIKDWRTCLRAHEVSLIKVAAEVVTKRPGWGLHLIHINSAMEVAGESQQALIETDSEHDLLER